jgi:hypothetical protein
MTVETSPQYPSDLNASYPAAGDVRSEGDDHIRNVKTVLKTTFPNVSGAVTPTHTELNYVDGVTSAIQTQLNAKGSVLLATASASASAAIDFTTGIDSTYEEYELHIINAVPATDSVNFFVRCSADGGSSFASSGYTGYGFTVTSGAVTGITTVTTGIPLTYTGNPASFTATYGGVNAVIRIYNPANAVGYKALSASVVYGVSGGTNLVFKSDGAYQSSTAVNAFRVLASSGNITSGKFKLYGVTK